MSIRSSITCRVSRLCIKISIISGWLEGFCRNWSGISGNLIIFASVTWRNKGRFLTFHLFNRLDDFKWGVFELWLCLLTFFLHSNWSIYSSKRVCLDFFCLFLSLFLSFIRVISHRRAGFVGTIVFFPLIRRINLDFLMRKLILVSIHIGLICVDLCIIFTFKNRQILS